MTDMIRDGLALNKPVPASQGTNSHRHTPIVSRVLRIVLERDGGGQACWPLGQWYPIDESVSVVIDAGTAASIDPRVRWELASMDIGNAKHISVTGQDERVLDRLYEAVMGALRDHEGMERAA